MLDECAADSPRNATIIPHTVPNSPINGLVDPVVARNVIPYSSFVSSTLVWRFIARETFSIPPKSVAKVVSAPTA
ncbi:MAG TPA: hypothetical protein VEF03_03850 [Candidatus Binataceae bacterium]|nr:hypothetical protein [Candidatus Binataceae bacterium]